jgi:hypothetical protein
MSRNSGLPRNGGSQATPCDAIRERRAGRAGFGAVADELAGDVVGHVPLGAGARAGSSATAPDFPESKVNRLVENVTAIWNRTAATRGTHLLPALLIPPSASYAQAPSVPSIVDRGPIR